MTESEERQLRYEVAIVLHDARFIEAMGWMGRTPPKLPPKAHQYVDDKKTARMDLCLAQAKAILPYINVDKFRGGND